MWYNNQFSVDVLCLWQADVEKAVGAAKAAFKRGSIWRQMNASGHGLLLLKLADLIERDQAYIAVRQLCHIVIGVISHFFTALHLYWLRSFSNLDWSRLIRAKCFTFIIISRSALTHLKKSDLATPICVAGAGVVFLVLIEGVVCGVLCRREQDDHAHYDQKDLHVLFHWTGSISSDKSRLI